MRKILIIILIIALLAGFGILVTSGVTLGSIDMPAIESIINNNKELDQKIANLDNDVKTKYASAQSELDASLKKLKTSKQKYQETINYSTEDEIQAANQRVKYDMSFIWTKIGLYATKNNVVIRVDVSPGSVEDLYNISFTATGEYLSISEFIYAIENDSKLGFKIEEFTMSPYAEDSLQATFIVKNIAIDKDSLKESANTLNNNTTTTTQTNTNANTKTTNDNSNTVNTNNTNSVNAGQTTNDDGQTIIQ